MIKQTMAVLLLSTGLASVAQAQSAPSFSGITIGGAAVTGFSDRNGTCTLDHDYGQGFGTNNIVALNGKSCAETTWAEAAANVDRDFGRGSNPRPIRGYQAGTVFVTNGNAPETRSSIGSRASDGNGNIITYDVYNYQPAGTSTTSAITIAWYSGDDRRLTSGTVTGTGYYRRDSRTLYGVTGYAPSYNAIPGADFRGVSVFQSDGTTGGLLDTTSQFQTIETTTHGSCYIRTVVRPLQAAGQRHLVTGLGRCDQITWDELDGRLSWVVEGVPAGQGNRPITTGINYVAPLTQEQMDQQVADADPDNVYARVDSRLGGGLQRVTSVATDGTGCRIRFSSGNSQGRSGGSCEAGSHTWRDFQGSSRITRFYNVDLSLNARADWLRITTPPAPEGSNDIREPNEMGVTTGTFTKPNGDTFTYTRVEIVGDPDHTLRTPSLSTVYGPAGINFVEPDEVTEDGYYVEDGSSEFYFHIEDYTPAAGPATNLADNGFDYNSITVTYNGAPRTIDSVSEANGTCAVNLLPSGQAGSSTGCETATWQSVIDRLGRLGATITFGNVDLHSLLTAPTLGAADPNAGPHDAYLDRTSAAVAVGDFDWDNPHSIIVADGHISIPADNEAGLCELDGGSGTYVIQAGSCSVVTWGDALAQGEVGAQNRALRGVPVNWLDLTIASTLPGYVAPPTEPVVDPADDLRRMVCYDYDYRRSICVIQRQNHYS